jgi:TatD DNase family protein
MLIDTHCHLNIMTREHFTKNEFLKFAPEEILQLSEFIKNAERNSVLKIINVGTDLVESQSCIEIAHLFKQCYAIIGMHPADKTLDNYKQELKDIFALAHHSKVVGIGECGIDLYHKTNPYSLQEKAFKEQIEFALQHNLPLSVHSRDSAEETLNCLLPYRNENIRGVIHCYAYDKSYAQEFINLNFVLGIGGTATYPKNNAIREAILHVGIKNIILETDAPYLAPQEIRGKKNEPAHIALIAQYLANLFEVSPEFVAKTTTETATTLFNLE